MSPIGRLSRAVGTRKSRWWGAGGVLLVGGVSLLAALLLSVPPPFPAPPRPNGYDDLVEAGGSIVGKPPGPSDLEKAAPEKRRSLVATNAEPLRRARLGLSRECAVPVELSRAYLEKHNAAMGSLRRVSRLLYAEATLAVDENCPAEAANAYLDLLRLAHSTSRRGLMTDALLGFAFESMGTTGLASLRDRMPEQDARRLANVLVEYDAGREGPQAVVAREGAWYRRTAPIGERFVMQLSGAARRQLRPAIEHLEESDRHNQARLRLLAIELALHAYHDRGRVYPARLDELVPGEIASLPRDPWSGRDFVYKRDGAGHLLYGVGPDGRDDGGAELPEGTDWRHARGDVRLKPPPAKGAEAASPSAGRG